MKSGFAAFVLFLLVCNANVAQEAPGDALFGNPYFLEVRLGFAFRELKKIHSDKRYFPTYLQYRA